MLYNHNKEKVIGKWDNIRIDGDNLVADADIDVEDADGKEISRKVEKGYLKGVSIGFDFKIEDFTLDHPSFLGIPALTKCELAEGSICTIPSNADALKLTMNGKPVEHKDEVLSALLSHGLTSEKPNLNIQPMKKILLCFAAMGMSLSDNAGEDHVVEAINKLKADKEAAELKYKQAADKIQSLEAKLSAEESNKINSLVDGAVAAKKIKADQKDHYLKLAKSDFESTKAIIESLAPHVTISEQLNKGGNGNIGEGEKKDMYAGWDFRKLSMEAPAELARIKSEDPDRYKALFNAAFKK